MKIKTFVVLTALGSFIWSFVLIYVGYSAGPTWQSALGSLTVVADQLALVAIAGVSVLYVVYFLWSFGRKAQDGQVPAEPK